MKTDKVLRKECLDAYEWVERCLHCQLPASFCRGDKNCAAGKRVGTATTSEGRSE